MGLYTPNASTLLYGGPGGGKTALAVSSFWDWRAKKLIANGKIITFGAEDNPALKIPEECRHTAKGTSLRLTSPLLDDQEFIKQFDLIMRKFVYDAQQGNPLDVLVIDGLSELDLLFEATYKQETGEAESKFAKWEALLSTMFATMMRANHHTLNCQVIVTARVMEKKKAKQQGKLTIAGDPGFMDFDYYPSLRGQFRVHLPHYYNLVLYVETVTARTKAGKVIPAHAVHMLRTGDFYVKSTWEHEWIAADLPDKLLNPMWPGLWAKLTGAMETEAKMDEGEVTE